MARLLADLLDHPALGGVVVVPGVAQHDHGGLRPDVLAVALPEHLEGVAVVRVAVDPDDVGLAVDPVDRLDDVVGALEEPGHLVQTVDEDEAAHLRELTRDRVDEVQRESGERRHRPGDVGDHEDLGLRGTWVLELRLGGHSAVAERVPHRVAEVERTLATVATLARQAHRQSSGQRLERLAQLHHLVPAGVHEVDVLGQRLAQRLGHRLDTTVRDQTTTDLGLDLLLEVLDPVLVLVALQTLLERGEGLRGVLTGLLHQLFEHTLEVEVPQRAVQVVRAADGTARLHAGVTLHGLSGHGAHHRLIAAHERLVEHLGQFLGRHALARASLARGVAGAVGRLHALHVAHVGQIGGVGVE